MMYIEIDKESVPYVFDIELEDKIFTIEIRYNSSFDFFTIDLYYDDEPILLGEKLTLNVDTFDIIRHKDLIIKPIIPMDRSNIALKITWENINDSVFWEVKE